MQASGKGGKGGEGGWGICEEVRHGKQGCREEHAEKADLILRHTPGIQGWACMTNDVLVGSSN